MPDPTSPTPSNEFLNSCCVVSVGVGQWYPKGIDRLAASLAAHAPWLSRLLWRDQYPPGSPPHHEDPYVFKLHAVAHAARTFRYVLWLDSCAWCVRDPLPLFEHVARTGGFFMEDGWWLGQWCSDAALRSLDLTRDETMDTPLITGGFWALDTHSDRGRAFLAGMAGAAAKGIFRGPWDNKNGQASSDPRCLGHRHDMVALSVLVASLEYPTLKGADSFVKITHKDDGDPRTLFNAQGM